MAVAIGTRLSLLSRRAMQTSLRALGRSPDMTPGAPGAAERARGGDADELQRHNRCQLPFF